MLAEAFTICVNVDGCQKIISFGFRIFLEGAFVNIDFSYF